MLVFRGKFGGATKILVVGALVALAASLGGCATRGGKVPYNVQNFGAPDAPAPADFQTAYHIGASDVLTVTVFRVPNLSGDLEVDASGNVLMPLVGTVPVQGMTNTEVAADLAKRLGSKYLQSPEVQVVVKSSQRQRITLDGAVAKPGVYPIAGNTSLVQSIALAGGTIENSNARRVVVFRTINGQRMAAAFDLIDIRRGLNPDPVIFGSDIIVVDTNTWRGRFQDVMSSIPMLAIFRPF
jgi:polysaccharide export outer membrane protein